MNIFFVLVWEMLNFLCIQSVHSFDHCSQNISEAFERSPTSSDHTTYPVVQSLRVNLFCCRLMLVYFFFLPFVLIQTRLSICGFLWSHGILPADRSGVFLRFSVHRLRIRLRRHKSKPQHKQCIICSSLDLERKH